MTKVPNLHDLDIKEEIVYDTHSTIQIIDAKLQKNDKCKTPLTKDLNVNGKAVQDSFDSYLGADALQSSHLKQALITPLHFDFARSDDKRQLAEYKEKGHFHLGTFIHMCILEPRTFERVFIEPNYSLSSTEGVEKALDFWSEMVKKEDEGEGKIKAAGHIFSETGLSLEKIDGKRAYLKALKDVSEMLPVTEDQRLKIEILKLHLKNYGNGIVAKIIRGSKREISFYYQNENGTKIKVRPDALQFKENIGVDAIISVKSTACEDLKAFMYQSAKLHYDLSEAMYQDVISKVTGRKFETTITIMLQTIEPYAIAVLVWNKDDIKVGQYKFDQALSIAEKAMQENKYLGYDSYAENDMGLIELELPRWNNAELMPQV